MLEQRSRLDSSRLVSNTKNDLCHSGFAHDEANMHGSAIEVTSTVLVSLWRKGSHPTQQNFITPLVASRFYKSALTTGTV